MIKVLITTLMMTMMVMMNDDGQCLDVEVNIRLRWQGGAAPAWHTGK